MKVALFEIQAHKSNKCINKDLSGGMGTKTWIGKSLRARIFEYVKKKNVVIPNITNAYLAAIFRQAGWQVKLIEANNPLVLAESADLALVPSSIVDCNHELEIVKDLKKQGLYIGSADTVSNKLTKVSKRVWLQNVQIARFYAKIRV